MTVRKIVLALVALLCIAPTAPASATTVVVCAGTWSWEFSPALGPVHIQGTGTVRVTTTFPDNTCVIASDICASGAILCTETPVGWQGSFTATYAGNCLSATIFTPQPWLIVGGAVALIPAANFTAAGVLANLCLLNPASGATAWQTNS